MYKLDIAAVTVRAGKQRNHPLHLLMPDDRDDLYLPELIHIIVYMFPTRCFTGRHEDQL